MFFTSILGCSKIFLSDIQQLNKFQNVQINILHIQLQDHKGWNEKDKLQVDFKKKKEKGFSRFFSSEALTFNLMRKKEFGMGRVIGFELSSQEPEKAAEFYSNVFGWEVAEPHWDYWAVSTGKDVKPGINGGIGKGPNDYPHGTRLQIEVDSIDTAISKAKENGAMIVRDKMEFDDFYLAYLVDTVGIGFGLIQRK